MGFRVFRGAPRPSADVLALFRDLDVVNVSDAMFGMGTVDGAIRPIYSPITRAVGPALTCSVSPGNGMMIRQAILLARPGDILVVNSFGETDRACLGGSVAMDMKANGIAALVLDGAIRDVAEIQAIDLPVYTRGITARSGSDHHGRGEVNGPIACGGVVVMPGDIVVAEYEGIAVVPLADAAAVAARAREVQGTKGSIAEVRERVAHTKPGTVKNFDKIKAAMNADGCREIDAAWRPADV